MTKIQKMNELMVAIAELFSDPIEWVDRGGQVQTRNDDWLLQQKAIGGLHYSFANAADYLENTAMPKLKAEAALKCGGTGEIAERNRAYYIGRIQDLNDRIAEATKLAHEAACIHLEFSGREVYPYTRKGNVAPAKTAGRDVELTPAQKQLMAMGVKLEVATDQNSEGSSNGTDTRLERIPNSPSKASNAATEREQAKHSARMDAKRKAEQPALAAALIEAVERATAKAG